MHLVRMTERWDPSRSLDFGYGCDCGQSQPCLHVLLSKGEHCGWDSDHGPEQESVRGICPRCGSPVVDATPEVLARPPWP